LRTPKTAIAKGKKIMRSLHRLKILGALLLVGALVGAPSHARAAFLFDITVTDNGAPVAGAVIPSGGPGAHGLTFVGGGSYYLMVLNGSIPTPREIFFRVRR
jgi:hypothetical protein